jgi:hypothetical protein
VIRSASVVSAANGPMLPRPTVTRLRPHSNQSVMQQQLQGLFDDNSAELELAQDKGHINDVS